MPTYFAKFDRPTHEIVVHDSTCRHADTARLMIRRAETLHDGGQNPERNQMWQPFEASTYNAAVRIVSNLGPKVYPGHGTGKPWTMKVPKCCQ